MACMQEMQEHLPACLRSPPPRERRKL